MQWLVYFLLLDFRWVTSEMFSSVHHMDVLLDTQKKTMKDLASYVRKETDRIDVIERYLNRFKAEHEIATQDVPFYLGNPMNAFTLIKRLTTDLAFVEKKIRKAAVFVKDKNLTYPSIDDFVGAIEGLVRLHVTYSLNVTQIANGELIANYTSDGSVRKDVFVPLSASDCFEIASGFYNQKAFKIGVEWMIAALDKFLVDREESFGLNEADLVQYICFGFYTIDDVPNSIKWTRRFLSLKPYDAKTTPRYAALLNKYKHRLAKEEQMVKEGKTPKKVTEEMLMEATYPRYQKFKVFRNYCRNDGPGVPSHIRTRLRCRYLTGPHAFLKLARVKLEQLHLEPPVDMLYDVMSDLEIQHLINISEPRLKRATTLKDGSAENSASGQRVAKCSFHTDRESPVVERLSLRVAQFTGLSMDTSEPLQVSNYGLGGHFDMHHDYCMKACDKWEFGNRMATIMFYMTEVAQGGATVLTELGLTVYPIKGAALVFMNLDAAGMVDARTYHGACPVLHGSKWVAVKWIRNAGQVFARPCDPQQFKKNMAPKNTAHKNKNVKIALHKF